MPLRVRCRNPFEAGTKEDKDVGGERSGVKNGRRYGTRGGKQIIRTEAVIIYVGRERGSPQPRNKNCSPGQSPGGKFKTSLPNLMHFTGGETFPDGIATTRRITTGYLEILLLSVSRQVQPDITVDTRGRILV